ncbi:hypothetical protein BGZ95_001994 [Linnemannia exigua]|uniref:Uncharacterized protein n=1 Tax=Linnemannia exigua TaxID=604196 RepID=A0AAD4H8M1_9FUNG|nr:hypothetical protein BGZ95_001994 [Linnemannia exigua]
MATVHAEELSISHLDDDQPKAPLKISTFEKSHWKIVPHPQQPRMGPKVAELTSVWWLDVSAVFSTATSNVPSRGGRYKVQWRMNLNVAQTDSVVVGTEFRAVTFRKDEDPTSTAVSQDRTPAIQFKPQTIQEFMSHTDRPGTIPARPKTLQEAQKMEQLAGYDANQQGFFTLTLPGEVILQEDPTTIGGGCEGGVLVQIRNHDKTVKMGMQIENVKLVPV